MHGDLILQEDGSKPRVVAARVLVWVFTISVMSLLIVLPVSFFCFYYNRRDRRQQGARMWNTPDAMLAKLVDKKPSRGLLSRLAEFIPDKLKGH